MYVFTYQSVVVVSDQQSHSMVANSYRLAGDHAQLQTTRCIENRRQTYLRIHTISHTISEYYIENVKMLSEQMSPIKDIMHICIPSTDHVYFVLGNPAAAAAIQL